MKPKVNILQGMSLWSFGLQYLNSFSRIVTSPWLCASSQVLREAKTRTDELGRKRGEFDA